MPLTRTILLPAPPPDTPRRRAGAATMPHPAFYWIPRNKIVRADEADEPDVATRRAPAATLLGHPAFSYVPRNRLISRDEDPTCEFDPSPSPSRKLFVAPFVLAPPPSSSWFPSRRIPAELQPAHELEPAVPLERRRTTYPTDLFPRPPRVLNSRAVNVANAAVALLNTASAAGAFFPFAFTAVRAYRPNVDLVDEKSSLKVFVIPQSLDTNPFSRGKVDDNVSIDVGVFNWVDPANELAQCDALMELVEQIKQQLEAPSALALADAPTDCGWQATANDPIFDPEMLQNNSVFASVSTLTYLTRRAR